MDRYLLQRHLGIDRCLEEAITSRRVEQVLEIGAGFTPRGARFLSDFGGFGLSYVEADLPAMAEQKRALLARFGRPEAMPKVVELDLLAETGPLSRAHVASSYLEQGKGTAVVIEGLLSYFGRGSRFAALERVAATLRHLGTGVLLANVELEREAGDWYVVRAFLGALGAFVRGEAHYCFRDPDEAREVLGAMGFAEVRLHRPRDLIAGEEGPVLGRVLEAWVEGGGDEEVSRESPYE